MRLDGVEVKVNVAGDQVSDAIGRLGVADSTSMRLWFYEDLSPGIGPLPLLNAGVILRVRTRAAGSVESTVKLRPCRLSQLTDDWGPGTSSDEFDYTVEEDRSTTNRSIAASCTVDHGANPVGQPPFAIAELVTPKQRAFLRDCGSIRVNLEPLQALGPIEATRWKKVGGAVYEDLKPRAERWSVLGKEYLEISVRTDQEAAADVAHRLGRLLADHDIAQDDDQQSKTRRVLDALALSIG